MRSLLVATGIAALAMTGTALADQMAKGEKVFKKCKACHALGEGAKNKVGPHLNGILGRAAGSVEGFKYSAIMKEKGEGGLVWDFESLNGYLTNPKKYLGKKGKMTFKLKNDNQRLNVIAYISSFDAAGMQVKTDDEQTSDEAQTADAAKPAEEQPADTAAEKPADDTAASNSGDDTAAEKPAEDTAAAMPAFDMAKGEKVFKKCKACHAVGDGAKNKVGPHLNGILGRAAGSVDGFKYSAVMKEKGEGGLVWDAESLDGYLTNPKKYLGKKGKMTFKLKKEDQRANVIGYISSFKEDGSQ